MTTNIQAAIDALTTALDGAQQVLLAAPGDLDGDAVGALVALARAIPRRWPACTIRIAGTELCPPGLAFLLGHDCQIEVAQTLPEQAFDVAIIVDGGPDRLGAVAPHFARAGLRVMVDHHRSSGDAAVDVAVFDPTSASTTQLLVAVFARWAVPLDAALAEPLFAGLVFDTSVFRYRMTSPASLLAAAEMLATGIDHARIVERVLLDQSEAKARLRGLVLNRFHRSADGRLARSWLTAAESERAETGGLVDDLVFIEGVEVGALLRGRADGSVKLSLRSKGGVDVAALARSLSERGGGHARAAGATLEGPLDEAGVRVDRAVAAALAGG
jgi:phosphoesterase RecJ-like protein